VDEVLQRQSALKQAEQAVDGAAIWIARGWEVYGTDDAVPDAKHFIDHGVRVLIYLYIHSRQRGGCALRDTKRDQ